MAKQTDVTITMRGVSQRLADELSAAIVAAEAADLECEAAERTFREAKERLMTVKERWVSADARRSELLRQLIYAVSDVGEVSEGEAVE